MADVEGKEMPADLKDESNRRNSAPLKKCKTKPRTKQPKKVKFIATEIRCQEQSKGGLKYDVILAEPAGNPPKINPSPIRTKSIENIKENIKEKLKAADERRLSLEANKMATLASKLSKIEEASKKKDEQNNVFILQTKEALDQKMETYTENREAYISDLKNKLKDHLEGVEKSRLSNEQQINEVRAALNEKLKTAAAQRDENIKKMVERLKKHEEQVKRVRDVFDEKVKKCELQMQTKLKLANERRELMEKEQLEKLHIQERRAEMVRQNKEKIGTQEEQEETASSG